MGVTSWLLRRTVPRPLLVTAPGGTAARLAVERLVRERGWRPASSPAQANTLIVAGADDRLEEHVRRVWAALPAPRVRVDVPTAAAAGAALAAVPGLLHDIDRQRAETTRTEPPAAHAPHAEHTEHAHHSDHGGHTEYSGHAGHGGHDHGMATMDLPGGVPMADRAADRDGLTLDQLHVPLGPALPLWPAGLIVHTRLQGDVIQHAHLELLTADHGSFWPDRPTMARTLDSCHRLLAIAGWEDAATATQRLRDEALAGGHPDVRPVATRVRRSRTLRWLLSGVGRTPDGDALDRLHGWFDGTAPDTRHAVDLLPALLDGAELAAARLIVASFDPDLDLLTGVSHG